MCQPPEEEEFGDGGAVEPHREATVFGGGTFIRWVSHGNVTLLHSVQSATRTTDASCCRSAQTSYSVLPPLSWRRTRSHQPHHGTLRRRATRRGGAYQKGEVLIGEKKLSHYIFPNFQDAQWSLKSLESVQTDSSITWWDFCFRCSLLLGDVLMASCWEDQSVALSSDLLSLYPKKIVINSKHEVYLIVRSKLFPTLRPSFCGL